MKRYHSVASQTWDWFQEWLAVHRLLSTPLYPTIQDPFSWEYERLLITGTPDQTGHTLPSILDDPFFDTLFDDFQSSNN